MSADVADVTVPFHIHTGADVVSCFYGHVKQSIFDTAKLKKDRPPGIYRPNQYKERPRSGQSKNARETCITTISSQT